MASARVPCLCAYVAGSAALNPPHGAARVRQKPLSSSSARGRSPADRWLVSLSSRPSSRQGVTARAGAPRGLSANHRQHSARCAWRGRLLCKCGSCWQLERRPAAAERADAPLRSRRGPAAHPADPWAGPTRPASRAYSQPAPLRPQRPWRTTVQLEAAHPADPAPADPSGPLKRLV